MPSTADKNFEMTTEDLQGFSLRRDDGRALDVPTAENPLEKEHRSKVGKWGEDFVNQYLMSKHAGAVARGDLTVRWMNCDEESGECYDFVIEHAAGRADGPLEDRAGYAEYIEVKTTTDEAKALFEMSYREWHFAQMKGDRFSIYRIFNAGREQVRLLRIVNPYRQWKDKRIGICLAL
mmetsp:Transcript_34334/g.98900  ORF Transcript_34334/g.98900 Transcript_34334/m.98900 type:complete len:178 (+) Transcript_34334:1496-2029(+)